MQDRSSLEKLATALGGLPVLGCRDDSPAQRAGVRYGDILLSVNGIATPDWKAFVDARSTNRSAMAVEIFRNGAIIKLDVMLDPPGPIDGPQLLAEILSHNIVPLPAMSRTTSSDIN